MLHALDMFSVGIGPSSSHTVGPMKAALDFVNLLNDNKILNQVIKLEVHLFGSLALTGEGHGTNLAIVNGLCGEHPKTIAPDSFMSNVDYVRQSGKINLLKKHEIDFDYSKDIILHKEKFLPQHANGMQFIAYQAKGSVLVEKKYFSIGGGFILDENQVIHTPIVPKEKSCPYPYTNAKTLLNLCKENSLTIADLVWQNELARNPGDIVKKEALEIIEVMHQSVVNGINTEGILPGKLAVRRRASDLYKKLNQPGSKTSSNEQRLLAMAYAMAVNEENAAFKKIVTAPTNGSAGTIAGVLEYYRNFYNPTQTQLIEFILTAGAIGVLFKLGASISAAEVGCQGEIGVSCSMAAAALTAVLGGNIYQVEKAAEIAMEHSLGMTCDPVEGLVQIPCIERNGVAASRAIDIANLVLLEPTPGKITLDQVIATMLATGRDMAMHYKETSLGGLAVNAINC